MELYEYVVKMFNEEINHKFTQFNSELQKFKKSNTKSYIKMYSYFSSYYQQFKLLYVRIKRKMRNKMKIKNLFT